MRSKLGRTWLVLRRERGAAAIDGNCTPYRERWWTAKCLNCICHIECKSLAGISGFPTILCFGPYSALAHHKIFIKLGHFGQFIKDSFRTLGFFSKRMSQIAWNGVLNLLSVLRNIWWRRVRENIYGRMIWTPLCTLRFRFKQPAGKHFDFEKLKRSSHHYSIIVHA